MNVISTVIIFLDEIISLVPGNMYLVVEKLCLESSEKAIKDHQH